tara:strand:- start:219 stop:578 length:360 start_codon:yes stop_codon:yes gene_type:complete
MKSVKTKLKNSLEGDEMSKEKTEKEKKQLAIVKSLDKARQNLKIAEKLSSDGSEDDYTTEEELLNKMADMIELIDLMSSHYEIVKDKIEGLEIDEYEKEIALERIEESFLWLKSGIEKS